MSFKEWSSAQSARSKDKPGDKSEDVPAADKPVAKPDKTSAEVAPARKS